MADFNWQTVGNQLDLNRRFGIQGNIIYEIVLPTGYCYIGQSTQGETRFRQHFGNSYYYHLGLPPSGDDAPRSGYDLLAQCPGKDVYIHYDYAPYGISDQVLDNFRKHYRFQSDMNIPTADLYDRARMDYAEILHVYRAAQTLGPNRVLNQQMGGQGDKGLYSITINQNGEITSKTLVLARSSTVAAAMDIFNQDNKRLLDKLQSFVTHYVSKHIKAIYLKAINQETRTINLTIEDLIKQIQSVIDTELAPQLFNIQKQLNLDFKPELKMNAAQDFAARASLYKQLIGKEIPKINNKQYRKLDSFIRDLTKLFDKKSYTLITIEDVFTKETLDRIKAQTKGHGFHVNKLMQSVPRALFKYEALLRFRNVFMHERNRIQPEGNSYPFATRKQDNRRRHADEESQLPYIEFSPNRNEGELKASMLAIYQQAHFYYGSNGDEYYAHFMPLVAGKQEVASLRTLPLTARERGTKRQFYSVYIHSDLSGQGPPTTPPIEADRVGAAYITKAGEDNGIQDMINEKQDNITDY